MPMSYDPHRGNPQPPSAAAGPDVGRRVVLILFVGVPAAAALAIAFLGALESTPGQSSAPLEGVAVFSNGPGVRVCSRRTLHNCRATRGVSGNRERYFATAYTLHAVPSCDDHEAYAYSRCEDAGTGGPHDLCMGEWGIFSSTASRLSDPRDRAEVEPRGFVMRCDEGIKSGTFAEEGY